MTELASISSEALAYITAHSPVTDMDLVRAVPRLLGKPILPMLQHLIRSGKIAVSYLADPDLNESRTARVFSLPAVELPHKMNSILRTGTKYGPNAHSGPIRTIRQPAADTRPRQTLPDLPAPNPELTRQSALPPPRRKPSASTIQAKPATTCPPASNTNAPQFWLSAAGALRIQTATADIRLGRDQTLQLHHLLNGSLFEENKPCR